MRLTILGANSALPVHGRYPTAQLLQIDQQFILLDCGEGTQLRLRELNTKWAKIDFIFISHFHGDHFFGLPGFLTSLSLLGRNRPIKIIAPYGVKKILAQLFEGCGIRLSYDIDYVEIEGNVANTVFENDNFEVSSIPMDHRIATFGFLFKERRNEKNIKPEMISKYNLDFDQIKSIKKGDDLILKDSSRIENSILTKEPDIPKRYAFCSDTRYNPSIAALISGVDVLYHESTYLENLKELASETMHTTAAEAGKLASLAQVKHLLIGHYSSRYKDISPLKLEAEQYFDRVTLAVHGLTIDI